MSITLFWMFLSMIASVSIVAISIQKRDAPKSLYFILISLLNALFVIGRFFEASSSSLEAALNGTILGYMGMPFVPVVLLLFILDYYDIKTNIWLKISLLILPSVTLLFIATPPLRHLYYTSYSYYPGPPIAQLMVSGTAFYYVFFVYFFLITSICLGFSLWGVKKYNKTERGPSLAVFFAALIPLLTGVLYMFGLTPLNLDLSQFSICFSAGFLCIAVYRLNLLQILPLAKDMILEQMNDAFIILDNENHYVESNSAAKKLFPVLSNMRAGQKVDISDLFPQLLEGLDGRALVPIMLDNVQQHYHLADTEILEKERKLGICYTLHDVTDTRKLLSELKILATYDNLTGIYNRASFYELSSHALELAIAQKEPVSAVGLDIDHFKLINDTYGHFCGDEIIRRLVKRISGRLRGSDIFGRVGGEEFNILLPNTNLENAMSLAQNLQKMVAADIFEFDGQKIPVTISIGVTVFDEQKHTGLERIFIDADRALYEAKETGRNKVCFYIPDGTD